MANHEQDQLFVVNPTNEPFSVKWGGYPYTVAPGQKLIFPRFIAEHFAKHLADKILLQKEKQFKDEHGKDKPFLNNKRHRPEVINSILVGVYQYFRPKTANDPNAAVAQMVEQINEPKPLDIGAVNEDKATGVLEEDDEDEVPNHTLTEAVAEGQPAPPAGPTGAPRKKTRAELFAEAKQLGLKPKPSDTDAAIEQMIKQF